MKRSKRMKQKWNILATAKAKFTKRIYTQRKEEKKVLRTNNIFIVRDERERESQQKAV